MGGAGTTVYSSTGATIDILYYTILGVVILIVHDDGGVVLSTVQVR